MATLRDRTREKQNETHISLECVAIVDREEQNHITTGIVGFGQDVQILLLRGPRTLERCFSIRKKERKAGVESLTSRCAISTFSAVQLLIIKYLESTEVYACQKGNLTPDIAGRAYLWD